MAVEQELKNMNAQLRTQYVKYIRNLLKAVTAKGIEGLSHPLLIKVHSDYLRAQRKVMFVGQETRDWDRLPKVDTIDEGIISGIVDENLDFYWNISKASLFWRSVKDCYQSLNPEAVASGRYNGYIWTNLVRCDQHKRGPDENVKEILLSIGNLVQEEVELTRPDAVVFFTGPSYDCESRKTFPGVEFHKVEGIC